MGDACQRLGDTNHAVKAYHLAVRIQTLAGFQNKATALYKIILRIDPKNAEAVSKSEKLLKEMEGVRHQHVSPEPGIASPAPQAHLPVYCKVLQR
jgi:cytochrome c-type biogenesis protein CcmH/NrfG